MSYIINKTDGTILATILDGTVDSSTSLVLIGKGSTQFGERVNENFVKLLESGAHVTAPASPLVGQLWFDKTTSSLKVYTGNIFKPISSALASNVAPTTTNLGDMWLDTSTRQLKVYTDSGFTLIGPNYTKNQGITGVFAGNIIDDSADENVVANLYISGTLLGVISNSDFTPNSAIAGLSTVESGLNFTANIVSPALTGIPTAPTADANTATTQIATTEFVTDAVDTAISSLSGSTDAALALKANIASPVFTGNPTAPTPSDGDNDTSIATTKFVGNAVTIAIDALNSSTLGGLALKANIASPALTGVPTAPTASSGTNTTQIATTQFVTTAINNIPADSELWKGADKFVSTSAPTSGDGEDGDIWIQV